MQQNKVRGGGGAEYYKLSPISITFQGPYWLILAHMTLYILFSS